METFLTLKDFIIIFYFYNYQFIKIFNNTSNQIVIYCLISFWILIKYILGQYEKKDNFNTKELIISFFCNLFIFILANVIYFLTNLITEGAFLESLKLIFFFNTAIKITLLSFTFDTLIYFIYNKKLKIKSSWLVLSSNETYKNLLNLSSKFEFSLIHTNIKNIFTDLQESKYKGIIIDHSYFLDKEIIHIISRLKAKETTIINPLNWCDKYLHKCPSSLISQDEIINLLLISKKVKAYPMKPMMAKPIEVAEAIFENSASTQ